MLKGTFPIAVCLVSLMGCATARAEPGDQPTTVYNQTTRTRTTIEYVPPPPPLIQQVFVPGCGQPNGGTGQDADGIDIVYETAETAQALAASGISVTPTGIVGRNFRLDPLACDGAQTARFILRGSRMAPDGWHVRIIRANSDCTADLVIVMNGVVASTLPGSTTRACRTQVR